MGRLSLHNMKYILLLLLFFNSRLLSYVSPEDFNEHLTPSHLLVGYLNSVLNHFWKQWSREYLLELRGSHRHSSTPSTLSNVKIGDVVVFHNEDHPRGFWRLTQVERLITVKDSHTRGAVVKLSTKNDHSMTLQHPLHLLYPLEINHCTEQSDQNLLTEFDRQPENNPENELPQDNQNEDSPPRRKPIRQSALRAQDCFKQWYSQLLNEDR